MSNLPVAPAEEEKNGTSSTGRGAAFGQARLAGPHDRQVLGMLAAEMDVDLGSPRTHVLHAGIAELGLYVGRSGIVSNVPKRGTMLRLRMPARRRGRPPGHPQTHVDAGRPGRRGLPGLPRRGGAPRPGRVDADLPGRLGSTDGQGLTVSTRPAPSPCSPLSARPTASSGSRGFLPAHRPPDFRRRHGSAVRLSIPQPAMEVVRAAPDR